MLFTKFANIATLYLLPHASVINNLPEHIDSVNCNNCNKIIIIFYNNVNAHLYMGLGWGGGGVVGCVGGYIPEARPHPSLPPPPPPPHTEMYPLELQTSFLLEAK